jgi:uncharacterized Zn finger protein
VAAKRYRWTRYPPRLSAADLQRTARGRAADLAKKRGRPLSPIVIEGRTIAGTFWGEAWCRNLEQYSDFASRLPRGRSYARSGAVIDLTIEPGQVTAVVSGTDLYDVTVTVSRVPPAQWRSIIRDSAGAIDSVVALLQGRLSESVMARLSRQANGLFPTPKEIALSCSCPDRATMCKHVAAVLYGIGARLDHDPALLFTLRKVKPDELIARASLGSDLTRRKSPKERKLIDDAELAAVFGLDIAPAPKAKKGSRPPALNPTSASSIDRGPRRRT